MINSILILLFFLFFFSSLTSSNLLFSYFVSFFPTLRWNIWILSFFHFDLIISILNLYHVQFKPIYHLFCTSTYLLRGFYASTLTFTYLVTHVSKRCFMKINVNNIKKKYDTMWPNFSSHISQYSLACTTILIQGWIMRLIYQPSWLMR